MKRFVIIADDLTGACDTGIKFRNAGLETMVLVDSCDLQAITQISEPVVAINTDTRSVTPETARQRVEAVLKAAVTFGEHTYYKKVDSVLRGNIASELEAFFQILKPDFALIAPAFPETGRRMRSGTIFIGEEDAPSTTVDGLKAISIGSNRSCSQIGLDIIRSGWEAVVQEADRLCRQGCTLLLADAWQEEDLAVIAQAVVHFGQRCIPVGSAGLASHLAGLISSQKTVSPVNPPECRCENGALMVVVGSRHPTTVEQVRQLKSKVKLDTYLLPVTGINQENMRQRVDSLFLQNPPADSENVGGILLTTDVIYSSMENCSHLLQKNAYNRVILDAISLSAAEIVSSVPVGGMIATGGDISSEILIRLQLNRIQLIGEPIPGIVTGEAQGKNGRKILLATKSGGFGDPDALLNLYQRMSATS